VSPGWADADRGLFSISVAAELAGLHPQTLRIYEREGLPDPARSADGIRRYSRRDIDRLAQICALTADGLNLPGIRRVLQMQEDLQVRHRRRRPGRAAAVLHLRRHPRPRRATRHLPAGVGWATIAAARAGHQAVTAWSGQVAEFLAGHASRLPSPGPVPPQ